jgi:hypothetical protein
LRRWPSDVRPKSYTKFGDSRQFWMLWYGGNGKRTRTAAAPDAARIN